QGLNRYLGTRVLLSGATTEGAPGLAVRPLGEFLLVGKQTPVAVFELLSSTEQGASIPDELDRRFVAALGVLRECRWDDAARELDALLSVFPGDGPSRFYLDLCRR